MSMLKDSEISKNIDCVMNTVETASILIVHAINILDISVLVIFKVDSGKAVFLISYFGSNYVIRLSWTPLSPIFSKAAIHLFTTLICFWPLIKDMMGVSQYGIVDTVLNGLQQVHLEGQLHQ